MTRHRLAAKCQPNGPGSSVMKRASTLEGGGKTGVSNASDASCHSSANAASAPRRKSGAT